MTDKLKQKLIDRIIIIADQGVRENRYQTLYDIFQSFDGGVSTVDQFISKVSILNDDLREILRKQYYGKQYDGGWDDIIKDRARNG